MIRKLLKNLENGGKRLLNGLLLWLLPRREVSELPGRFDKILVLRLDQRIGNGILLLPLLRAIRENQPDAELHLVLHAPVSRLIEKYTHGLVDVFWHYDQKYLLSNPLRFVKWACRLRREQFDLILSSHNPDNFSLSQALLGRWCSPGLLVGFRWKESTRYYHLAIPSSAEKHYSDAQLDLWRRFHPETALKWGGMEVPETLVTQKFAEWNFPLPENTALFWLGATGDKVIPADLIAFVYEQIRKQTGLQVQFALGPADRPLLKRFPEWIREQTVLWERDLQDTAVFFRAYRLFVSGDTGPMHLAVALGLPTLTLFVSSNMEQYGYQDGERHFSIKIGQGAVDRDRIRQALQQLGERITYDD